MKRPSLALVALVLSAAAPHPGSRQWTDKWIDIEHKTGWFVPGDKAPPPSPPLPFEITPKRLSEIRALTGAQWAEWFHAPSLADVQHVELEPTGDGSSILWLSRRPVPGQLGLCTVEASRFGRSIPVASEWDTGSDPVVEPDGFWGGERRYVFPTRSGACPGSARLGDTIQSTSEQAIVTALKTMRWAQARIGTDGSSRLPMTCTDRIGPTPRPMSCREAARAIKRLTPNQVRTVFGAYWKVEPWQQQAKETIEEGLSNAAWMLNYVDPADRSGRTIYSVTLRGIRRPTAIRIEHCRRFTNIHAGCAA